MALETNFESKKTSSDTENEAVKDSSNFSSLSLKELHHQLDDAVDKENYELAAKIRDEISKRS
jgi:hypothetical protein